MQTPDEPIVPPMLPVLDDDFDDDSGYGPNSYFARAMAKDD